MCASTADSTQPKLDCLEPRFTLHKVDLPWSPWHTPPTTMEHTAHGALTSSCIGYRYYRKPGFLYSTRSPMRSLVFIAMKHIRDEELLLKWVSVSSGVLVLTWALSWVTLSLLEIVIAGLIGHRNWGRGERRGGGTRGVGKGKGGEGTQKWWYGYHLSTLYCSSYRLHPDSQLPTWYTSVDTEEDRRRWKY